MYLFGVETLIIDHLGKDRVEFTEPWTISIAPGGLLTITDQFVRLFRDVQSMKANLRSWLCPWQCRTVPFPLPFPAFRPAPS